MATTNFIKVEAKKPINEPKAALVVALESDLLSSSPINAPIKGPIIIPVIGLYETINLKIILWFVYEISFVRLIFRNKIVQFVTNTVGCEFLF